MRYEDMRKYPLVLVAVLLTAGGCGSTSESTGSAASSNSATPESPSPAVPTGSFAASNSATTAGPAPTVSRGDPDNPQDLAGAPVVLRGPVHVSDTCAVLTTRARRWALVGAAARTLTDGQIATVRGRPIAVPPGCDADFALAVRGIS